MGLKIKSPSTLYLGSAKGGSGGGGGGQTGEYFIKVIDYDGTVLDEQWLDDGSEYTLPANPDRTDKGLVFQEWSSSETITNGKITIDKNNVMVGAIYTTSSGQNEFDIELNANTGLTITLNIDGDKDWGDGSAVDNLTTHTYSQEGKYTIKTDGTIITSSSSANIFGVNSYTYFCTAVRLATVTTIPDYAFSWCYNIEYISMSNVVTSIGKSLGLYSGIKCIIVPNGITTVINLIQDSYRISNIVLPYGLLEMGQQTIANVYTMDTVVIPKTVTTFGNMCFYQSYSIKKLILPSALTTLGNSCFRYCYILEELINFENTSVAIIPDNCFGFCKKIKKIKFPSTVTILRNQSLYENTFCLSFDFSKSTNIVNMVYSNNFSGINQMAKIKVPSTLYSSWKTATNWGIYANYIVAV